MRPGDLGSCPCVPVATGTHGQPQIATDRVSLTVHEKVSQLTVGDGPDLCKAVLQPGWLSCYILVT